MKISGEKLRHYIDSKKTLLEETSDWNSRIDEALQNADKALLITMIGNLSRDLAKMVCPRCDAASRELTYTYVLREYFQDVSRLSER